MHVLEKGPQISTQVVSEKQGSIHSLSLRDGEYRQLFDFTCESGLHHLEETQKQDLCVVIGSSSRVSAHSGAFNGILSQTASECEGFRSIYCKNDTYYH